MKHLVFYDAECPFCFNLKKILQKLDWRGQVEWIAVQEVENNPEAYPYMQYRHDLMYDEIHMLTASGRLYSGFSTVRRLFLALPITIPLSLFLYLPFLDRIGAPLYKWFSTHRYEWFGRYPEPVYD
ncbi:thiol-disulfide oxidoreductase DCC family protein [Guptibacillus algicola]|uniref:thiol-disulfide oxidoreductase DCC family protein n=1 Tax=Guptibacillus algicola TaxID=225844 RepID=UPI001CD4F9A0|nr:DUF393 domain-containing protein [Alkalihalobacillus algicola]MCA0988711.1 DUF393 domain-containing protein [Alkalihalobacillus algicola]